MIRLSLRVRLLLMKHRQTREQLVLERVPTESRTLNVVPSAGGSSRSPVSSVLPLELFSPPPSPMPTSADEDETPTPIELLPHVPVGLKPTPETYKEVRALAERQLEQLELRRRPRGLLQHLLGFLRRLFRR